MDDPHPPGSAAGLAPASEADLLCDMAGQAARPAQARAAWEQLYLRHHRYVFVVTHRAYGSFLGEDGTADLVVDTFRKAFEWAGRQDVPEELRARFTGESPDETRRRVLGWLGAIAQRSFQDRFREEARRGEEFQEFAEQWAGEQPLQAADEDPRATSLVRAALAALTPDEAEALRVSLPWYHAESQSFAVPRGEAARVAALLGASPEALRQRRYRAIRKLERSLEESGYQARGEVTS